MGTGPGDPQYLKLHSFNKCLCLGLLWLAGWDVPPIFILMIQGRRWAGSKKTAHVPFSLVVCLIFLNRLKLWNLHVRLFYPLHLFQRHPPFFPPQKKQQRTGKPLPFPPQVFLLSGRLLGGQCWDSLGSPWGPGPWGVGAAQGGGRGWVACRASGLHPLFSPSLPTAG